MPPSPSTGTFVVIDSSPALCYIITKATAANQSLVLETESPIEVLPVLQFAARKMLVGRFNSWSILLLVIIAFGKNNSHGG